MSVQAVRLGGLALYGAHPLVDRDILVYEEVEPGLLIFDAMDARVRAAVIDAVTAATVPKVLRLQSIDLATTPAEVEDLIRRGMTVVYEYIDELTEHITGTIPDFVFERHRQLLADPRVFVIATADKLFAEVRRARSRDCLLSTNGVDIEVWRVGASAPTRGPGADRRHGTPDRGLPRRHCSLDRPRFDFGSGAHRRIRTRPDRV